MYENAPTPIMYPIPTRLMIRKQRDIERRKNTILKYKGRCAKCNKNLIGLDLTIDHIWENRDTSGGQNIENNLQLLCWKCHKEKTKLFAKIRTIYNKNLSKKQSIKINDIFIAGIKFDIILQIYEKVINMDLYKKEQLDIIRRELKNGNTKFSVGEYKCIFSPQGDANILIQRIPNFMMGLAYKVDTNEFIYNYPHLNNIKPEGLAEIKDGWVQPKTNGTNIGFIKLKDGSIVHRTRGSINPDRFVNTINVALLEGKKTLLGVPEPVFTEFLNTYQKTFNAGKASKIIDDYGNIDLETAIIPILKESLSKAFNGQIVGIFGELIMPCNPISIDGNLKFGIYKELFDQAGKPIDFRYIIFDCVLEDADGSIFFQNPNNLKFMFGIRETDHIQVSDTRKLSELNQTMEAYPIEEGIVIKGFADYGYWKFKREDVLAWERLMGKLSNVLYYSADHIFQQGLGFSAKEIFEDKVLTRKDNIDSIVNQVWQEVNASGVTRQDLIDYFTTKDKKESDIDRTVNHAIYNNLLLLVAPELQKNGIVKSKLYLEMPKYLFFDKEPMFFDEKKQKWRSNEWYNKMIGSVIGRVFQAEIQAEKDAHKKVDENGKT